MTSDRWARVKRVLADVLLAPQDQRTIVLERACAGDPSLAEEVQALIEAEAGAGPLDAPARLGAETQPFDSTASTVPLAGRSMTWAPIACIAASARAAWARCSSPPTCG